MSQNFVITAYGYLDDQGGLRLIENPKSQLEPFYIEGEDSDLLLRKLADAFGHKVFHPEAITWVYSYDDLPWKPIKIALRNHQEFKLLRVGREEEIPMGMTVEDGSLVFKESRSNGRERRVF